MRKEIKARARRSLKKHYLLFVAVCLIALFLSSESSSFDNVIHLQVPETSGETVPESGTPGRGVLGPLINGLTSGTFERRLAAAINSFVGSQTAGEWCMVLAGLAVVFVFWFFCSESVLRGVCADLSGRPYL